MKEQLKKLNELNIDLELFYSITIYNDKIILQGYYSTITREMLERRGFEFKLSKRDWIESINNKIEFILTFKP